MTGWWGWLAAAAGLVLLPRQAGARAVVAADPRHRAASGATSRQRWPGLVLAAALALLAAAVAGAPAALPVLLLAGLLQRQQHRRAGSPAADQRSVALVLDLLAAALAAGSPPERAIAAVADSVETYGSLSMRAAVAPIAMVGRLLQLGSDPIVAWARLDREPGLGTVGTAGRRCAHSGARLATALTDAAAGLRAEHRDRMIARAQRTGVWSLLPLGCCFLPAFVCLGVVPVVLGVAGQVVHGG